MSEADLKRAVIDYLEYQTNLGKLYADQLFTGEAIEVRGKTRRKIKGCKKGTADLMVLKWWGCPDSWYGSATEVYFLELKSAKGRQTKEQKEFQKLVEVQGCQYEVIRSIEELQKILEER